MVELGDAVGAGADVGRGAGVEPRGRQAQVRAAAVIRAARRVRDGLAHRVVHVNAHRGVQLHGDAVEPVAREFIRLVDGLGFPVRPVDEVLEDGDGERVLDELARRQHDVATAAVQVRARDNVQLGVHPVQTPASVIYKTKPWFYPRRILLLIQVGCFCLDSVRPGGKTWVKLPVVTVLADCVSYRSTFPDTELVSTKTLPIRDTVATDVSSQKTERFFSSFVLVVFRPRTEGRKNGDRESAQIEFV